MGYFDSKTRIIEFNGLPGSGKTTISQVLGQYIKKKNGTVSFKYFRHWYHDYTYSMCMSPLYYNRAIRFVKYSQCLDNHHSLRYSLLPLKFIRMYEHFVRDNKQGVLIIDQGFIQGMISLTHTELFPQKELLLSLLKASGLNDLPIVFVNCKCSIDKTTDRLLTRQTQGSRLQQINKNELKNTMSVQEQNLTYIRSSVNKVCPNIKSIAIDTELSLEYNAELIMNYL